MVKRPSSSLARSLRRVPWRQLGLRRVTLGRIPAGYLDASDPAARNAWKLLFKELHFFARREDDEWLAWWQHDGRIKIYEAPVVMLDSEGQLTAIGASLGDALLLLAVEYGRSIAAAIASLEASGIGSSRSVAQARRLLRAVPNPNERSVRYQTEGAGTALVAAKARATAPQRVEDLLGMRANDRLAAAFLETLRRGKRDVEYLTGESGLIETVFLDTSTTQPVPVLGVRCGDPARALAILGKPTLRGPGWKRWDDRGFARHFTIEDGRVTMITVMLRSAAP